MKTKLILLALGSSLLSASALQAQSNSATNNSQNFGNNRSTNSGLNSTTAAATNAPTRSQAGALERERLLFPLGLTDKLKLTDAQRMELKPIEDEFAKTSQEYKTANQPRIDAAHEANRQARVSKDPAQIQAAHTQLQQVWAGLQPDRVAAVHHVRSLLTPEQLKILDDPKNQWRDLSAKELSVK